MFKVSVPVPLKRAASRRNSTKSKTDFTLEGLDSVRPFFTSHLSLPFISIVQKIIFPNHLTIDLESEYGLWIERGDKVYKTSYRRVMIDNTNDSRGVSFIDFQEILSLPVTLFQYNSVIYFLN
jgi:hypothetical protein